MSEDDQRDEEYDDEYDDVPERPRISRPKKHRGIIIGSIIGMIIISSFFLIEWDKAVQQIEESEALDTAKKNLDLTLRVLQPISEPYATQTPPEMEETSETTITIQTEKTKPQITITDLEREVHNWTNHYRTQYGLNELEINIPLSNVAENHSQDMASKNYFSHTNLQGESPTDRAELQGFNCHIDLPGNRYVAGIGENIWQGWTYRYTINGVPSGHYTQSELAKKIVDDWMGSPSHRESILTDFWLSEGIGITITEGGKTYATQNFC